MQMKLFFTQGAQSSHQVKNPVLNFSTDLSEEERVEVGAFTELDNKFANNDDEMVVHV